MLPWEVGSTFLGFGVAIFSLVAPMLGVTLPRWLLSLLLALSIILILVWPVSWFAAWAQNFTKTDRSARLIFIAAGAIIGGFVFGVVWDAINAIPVLQVTQRQAAATQPNSNQPTVHDNITWSETERPIKHVRSMPANLTLVDHFAITGTNNRATPIKIIDAYLKSLVTGEVLPAYVERVQVPAKGSEIQAHATFKVMVPFPNEEGPRVHDTIRGISLENLWKRFSIFELIFETEEKKYTLQFDQDVTKRFMDDMASLLRGAPGEKAIVLPEARIVLSGGLLPVSKTPS